MQSKANAGLANQCFTTSKKKKKKFGFTVLLLVYVVLWNWKGSSKSTKCLVSDHCVKFKAAEENKTREVPLNSSNLHIVRLFIRKLHDHFTPRSPPWQTVNKKNLIAIALALIQLQGLCARQRAPGIIPPPASSIRSQPLSVLWRRHTSERPAALL